jgi:hypothetical protein
MPPSASAVQPGLRILLKARALVTCMFIVHAGASAAQPGLRINLSRGGGTLMRQFPDAFAPYMHFGCSMEVGACDCPYRQQWHTSRSMPLPFLLPVECSRAYKLPLNSTMRPSSSRHNIEAPVKFTAV